MKDLDFIHVGTFSSPVGLKGEIRVNFLTSSFEFFKNLKEYFDVNHSNFYNWMFYVSRHAYAKKRKCVHRVY